MTLKETAKNYANQANVLLSSMTGLIIATASKLIPSQDQIILIIVFAALWSEAYYWRLQEMKLNAEIRRTTPGNSTPKPT